MVRALFFVPGLRSELAKTCGHAHKEGQALPIKRGRPSPGFNTKSHSSESYGIFYAHYSHLTGDYRKPTYLDLSQNSMLEMCTNGPGMRKAVGSLAPSIVACGRHSEGLNHSVIAAVNGDLRAGRCGENIACDG